MADGVEVRGNRIRIYFRYQGELCREPIPGEATQDNIDNAHRLVGMITFEIKQGSFDYARHFPHSPKVQTGTVGHYLDLLLEIKRNEMAPSGFRGYASKVKNHIRPQWGARQADSVDTIEVMSWVQKDLMPKLHNKTIRDILNILHQTYTLYRARNRSSHDPTLGIDIKLPDAEEVDPFDQDEITRILTPTPGFEQELNLAQFMVWSGPRVSEAISLAWEDVIDLEAGIIRFRRGQVRGHYKVTKTRRSNRELKLLGPAHQALLAQVRFTRDLPPVEVPVTERDNRTTRVQRLRFVFHKSTTRAAWSSSDVLLKSWWRGHLESVGVRYRSPNNCRHTFASQILSTGVAPVEWVAEYMGHTSTAMIHRHYGTWIPKRAHDQLSIIETALSR
ncbi:Arm DNA-binding domain-containing protein [Halopseudomonas phragmitis]|uniref:Site-specific integrase n=1 Tax=Halopseudomonas phragmitis TaxID=1931241 RepID=A0A1V0B6M5_9GAMM|nr:DUF3596 domain-containing protein [Halopseudomonas phragmitis]AQZ95434.1 site-specific integrase [Halopseudomonas phragmitis]